MSKDKSYKREMKNLNVYLRMRFDFIFWAQSKLQLIAILRETPPRLALMGSTSLVLLMILIIEFNIVHRHGCGCISFFPSILNKVAATLTFH